MAILQEETYDLMHSLAYTYWIHHTNHISQQNYRT